MSAPEIEHVVETYGLNDFPFTVRELNPLANVADLKEICWIDGWRDAQSLDEFLAARAQAKGPALVVVAGGSGTGRGSLANWVLHTWARHQGISPAELIVGRRRATNLHADEQLWNWSLNLEPELRGANVQLSGATESTFTAIMGNRPAALAASVRRLLALLTGDLAKTGHALAGVVERIEAPDFLSLGAECISGVNTLLVLTVVATHTTEAEVLNNERRLLDPDVARLVRLRELSGKEATTVVQERWKRYASGAANPIPFTDRALEEAFDQPRRSVRDVFHLMRGLLVSKAAGATERWPEAQNLAFSEQELQHRIPYVDGWWLR
jgi:hypothetical protein